MNNIYGPVLPPIQGPKDPAVLAREIRVAERRALEAEAKALADAWAKRYPAQPSTAPMVYPGATRWIGSGANYLCGYR